MEYVRPEPAKMTERDRQMLEKLNEIEKDPEAYFATARKLALHEEARRAFMPWLKYRAT